MARHEQEALWALAAEELEGEERARVAEHLAGCEDCARKLAEVRQAQARLRLVQEEVPAVRWAQVDDRIQSAAARRLARLERPQRWPWALATAGALAAVLTFVVLRPVASPAPANAPVAVREQEPPPAPALPVPREEPTPAPTPAIATRVESATGAWIREAKAPERSLQAGTQLRAGASVRTRAKSGALLRLPDASRVRLSPDSEVTLARTEARDVHLNVTRGRLTVQASHAARQGFTVEAAGIRASVVGTLFSVERTPRGAVVAVLEGKVRVEAEGQTPRFVSAGERLEVLSGQRSPKARALSSQDRQAFQAMGLPLTEAVPSSRPVAREPALAVAQAPSTGGPAPTEAPPSESSAPASAPPEPPMAAAAPPAVEESGSEFAPYPVPTSPEPVEALVLAPSSTAPEARQGFASQSPWAPPQPGVALPGTEDARFLWHAREQLSAMTCESFLVGLAEIAKRSPVREFREQARYLRARCFEERLAPAEATAEYRRYLREFPKGRYVREAKAALLP